MKFLLSHPNNKILEYAAYRNKRAVQEYKNMVKENLETLTKLKCDSGFNIEVRLYEADSEKGPPSFRLFFIDDSCVLVSYYFFGEGEGLQMPQIEVRKPADHRDTENFYYAFNHYFHALWEQSKAYEPRDSDT